MSSAAAIMGLSATFNPKHYRACMVCSILRTPSQFLSEGCPNCEAALQMAHSQDVVNDCTSQNWNGTIALMENKESWVAKFHRLEGYVLGIYAVQVVGNLGGEYVDMVKATGMRWVRRDGNKEDEELAGLE